MLERINKEISSAINIEELKQFANIFKLQLDTESVIAGITKANGEIDKLDAGLIETQTQLAKTEQRMSSRRRGFRLMGGNKYHQLTVYNLCDR